jgi:hypothetical protein
MKDASSRTPEKGRKKTTLRSKMSHSEQEALLIRPRQD